MSRELDKLIETIGLELAAKLCHEFAGQGIYINRPSAARTVKKDSTFQAVIDCIGIEAVQQLQKAGISKVYIQQFKREFVRQKHQEIIDNYRGESINDYAAKVGMSSMAIRNIFREHGIKTPGRPPQGGESKFLAGLWQGEGSAEFSRKHSCTPHVAQAAIRHAKVTLPPEHGIKTLGRPPQGGESKFLAGSWQGEGPAEFSRKHGCTNHVARAAIRIAKATMPPEHET